MLTSAVFSGEKILGHLDKLAAWKAGDLPSPVTVELDLTNLCNHACPGCTFSYLVNISKDSIPLPKAKGIVDELGQMGVKAITFSGGGEPLVYGPDRVLELMRSAKSWGMDVALITNGSLLRDTEFLSLCQWIRVSLDGYDPDTFARFHGRNDKEFAKVVDNLRAMGAAEKHGCTLGVGFLTDHDSIERGDFEKMAEFCSQIGGLDYVQFRPLVQNMVADPSLTGGYAGFSKESLQSIRAAYRESKKWDRDDFKVLISDGKYDALANPGRTYSRCLGHFMEAVVSADQRVYICCHGQGVDKFCLGDLREDSFRSIWHSERAKSVYESLDPRVSCPPACRLHLQNTALQSIQDGFHHPNFI